MLVPLRCVMMEKLLSGFLEIAVLDAVSFIQSLSLHYFEANLLFF